MSSLNKENSTVMSLRVPNDQRDEFNALAREIGVLTSRQLRMVFTAALDDMREQANERRKANGLPNWEDEWNSQEGQNA
jgi:hypothetical protein